MLTYNRHLNTFLEVKIVFSFIYVYIYIKSDLNILATFGTLCGNGDPQHKF